MTLDYTSNVVLDKHKVRIDFKQQMQTKKKYPTKSKTIE